MSNQNARRDHFNVDGIPINLLSMPHAVRSIVDSANHGQGFCVFTLNLDHCAKLKTDRAFQRAYKRASFVTADGFPIVLLGRLNGTPVQRTTGADLVEPVCREATRPACRCACSGRMRTCCGKRKSGCASASGAPCRRHALAGTEVRSAVDRRRCRDRAHPPIRGTHLPDGDRGPREEIFAARCLDQLPGIGLSASAQRLISSPARRRTRRNSSRTMDEVALAAVDQSRPPVAALAALRRDHAPACRAGHPQAISIRMGRLHDLDTDNRQRPRGRDLRYCPRASLRFAPEESRRPGNLYPGLHHILSGQRAGIVRRGRRRRQLGLGRVRKRPSPVAASIFSRCCAFGRKGQRTATSIRSWITAQFFGG